MTARFVITGSRFWEDDVTIAYAIEQARKEYGDGIVVQGECPYGGADLLAKEYAKRKGYQWESFYAEVKNGKIQGPKRNAAMIRAGADIVLAFPISSSRGTVDTILKAREAGIPVKIYPQGYHMKRDVSVNRCVSIGKSNIHFIPHKECILR